MDSSVKEPIFTQIKDYMSYIKGERTRAREVILSNVSENTIDYMRGWVEIYRSNKRIRLLPFEVKYLRANKKQQVYFDALSVEEDTIDEFHTFLEEIRVNEKILNNQFLYGYKGYRIYPNINEMILSPMERITGFNLKWLKGP
ncbi:hypothetical protein [Paenibacillus tyrfis]|uniref:hypothetical protein n=1 Tax=Paenibacillus tyrfis TaxID=1501230 RepID=UPI000B597A13|nr:hypothetical protein [Paenibacillus tyrfis]